MMKYECLLCGAQWGDPEASESDISHGYCPLCLRAFYTDKIRRSQVKSGYSDCFNRGYNDCSEENCWFRAACQDAHIEGWRGEVFSPGARAFSKI